MSSHILRRTTHCTRDILSSSRRASTSANPYPYPSHPNPYPHQIFHLPRSATQTEIKQRYYDLVRIYHPDSPIARKYPADVAQVRFQAISKAYDSLRGKSAVTGDVVADRERPVDLARFRPSRGASSWARRPHVSETAGDERWKERVLLGATVLAVAGFVVQTHVARQKTMAQVMQGTRAGSSGSRPALADEALAESADVGRTR